MLKTVDQFCRDVGDVLFPHRCANCREPCESAPFCEVCDAALVALENRSQCFHCGSPVAIDGSPCQRCLGRGYRLFEEVANLGVFADPLKALIHRMKYSHGWGIAELLADRCVRLPRVQSILQETDVFVPVPLHTRRQIVRGFNQASIIAARLGRLCYKPVRHPAIRLLPTPAQPTQSSREARVRNMRNVFALTKPACVRGRRITLVDDVMTTGATLKSLARTLKAADPALMNVLTLAIADPTGHSFEAV